ncbi:hypothetical protein [Rhizobium sp. SSA_523]|uniref:hypothetical protein n=1 Tax=Rhizobium sp. SSA_523 TaxID=2952477 RepID=UPI0020908273|nr:hypothetical protein [Rhizobium sp. SSA_523]MCO5733948.1 hypothetical protein [Rhizobium sp. SSA_523]WKC24792.1 hypothetical protein QTJ18_12270 [Rhizobium sp. SSA_523]
MIARLRERGADFDDDPAAQDLLEDWISGVIDSPTLRQRYLDLVRHRAGTARRRFSSSNATYRKGRSTLAGSALPNPDILERPAMPGQEDVDTGDDR